MARVVLVGEYPEVHSQTGTAAGRVASSFGSSEIVMTLDSSESNVRERDMKTNLSAFSKQKKQDVKKQYNR